MFLGGGIFGLALIVLWAYCIYDVIRTDEKSVQNLPKMIWLLIVIVIPSIGSIAWLLLGRPSAAALRPGARLARSRPEAPPPTAPIEQGMSGEEHQAKREEALRKYNEEREAKLREQEEQLRRREEELRRRETEDGPA